jgi:hypothetical protein
MGLEPKFLFLGMPFLLLVVVAYLADKMLSPDFHVCKAKCGICPRSSEKVPVKSSLAGDH